MNTGYAYVEDAVYHIAHQLRCKGRFFGDGNIASTGSNNRNVAVTVLQFPVALRI